MTRLQYDNLAYDNDPSYSGLGFLPGPAIAASAGAGPVGWVIAGIATAASFLSKLFGGGDDQATSFRPPPNAKDYFIEFHDNLGDEYVSFDMGPETQRISAANGNRWDDMSSYYSAFISGSTRSGASSAARRVIEDVARQHGVSISRAADLVLQAAGAIRIVKSFLPGSSQQQQQGSAPDHLPPACYGPTYHPFPLGHPQQDLCVPYPPGQSAGGQGSQQQQRPGSQGSGSGRRARPGYWVNPQTGLEEPIPQCPEPGLVFDPQTGQCVPPSQLTPSGSDGFPWWILLALAGVYVVSQSGDEPRYASRRVRR